MTESILNSIKKLLGIPTTDTAFDEDILVNINSTFFVLNQLGVGPDTVYSIDGDTAVWSDFLSTDLAMYQAVKTYIFLKVRLVFDPPGTSFLQDSIQRQIAELEWRLNVQIPISVEPPVIPEP